MQYLAANWSISASLEKRLRLAFFSVALGGKLGDHSCLGVLFYSVLCVKVMYFFALLSVRSDRHDLYESIPMKAPAEFGGPE